MARQIDPKKTAPFRLNINIDPGAPSPKASKENLPDVTLLSEVVFTPSLKVVLSSPGQLRPTQLRVELDFKPSGETVADPIAAEPERGVETLTRWITKERPVEVYVRRLQREVRLPGLRTAARIKEAADELVKAGWLRPPPAKRSSGPGRGSVSITHPVYTDRLHFEPAEGEGDA